MKVFLATLFFVGFAAAVPCPILERFKNYLQNDVKVLRVATETIIESKWPGVKEGIATFVQNPYRGSDSLNGLFIDAARIVVNKATNIFLEMDRDIKTAVSGLEQIDPKLVKDGVKELMDNLAEQLRKNVLSDKGKIYQLLKKARQLVKEDVKILESDPSQAPKIQEKLIAGWLMFVDQCKGYVRETEQLVQDTLDAIEKLYQ